MRPALLSAFRTDPTRANVLVLALCQALGQTGNSLGMTVAALVGYSLADDKSLSTLPVAVQFVAAMAVTMPLAQLMRRRGRRLGFTLGAAAGIAGALTAAWAILAGSFALFVAAGVPLGVYQCSIGYYRFAAADTASEAFRPRAIGLVLAGGVVASLAGPELAKWSRDLLAPVLFAGSFLVAAVLALASLALVQAIRIPRPGAAEQADSGRPLSEIARRPAFVVAVLAAAFGFGSMTLVMTATPLAMADCGFSFDGTATVLQWHGLAMFLPGFFTGHLIGRFGALRVVMAGALLTLAALAVNLSGLTWDRFWGGLVLLGLGWNFMFVGGTALLATAHSAAERAKTQALNDFLLFTTVALAALSSGALHSRFGWASVNLAVLPLLAAALAAALWLRSRRGAVRAA